jgi:hypothetical protein
MASFFVIDANPWIKLLGEFSGTSSPSPLILKEKGTGVEVIRYRGPK